MSRLTQFVLLFFLGCVALSCGMMVREIRTANSLYLCVEAAKLQVRNSHCDAMLKDRRP